MWLAYLGTAGAGLVITMRPLHAAGALAGEAAWFSIWGIALTWLALRLWPIARYVRVSNASFARFLAMAVSLALGLGAAWFGLGLIVADALAGVLPSVAPAFRSAWPSLWLTGTLSALAVLLLMHAVAASDDGEAAARRALESDLASRDAELRALRAQLDPHFLFNCLHSISAMTGRDPDGARRMCLELADFFRASLKAGAESRIALAVELQLVRGYLGIEQVRFGRRLRVEVDAPDGLDGVMVPPLVLQPLVENAVRHGIATLVDGGGVRVAVGRAPDRVEIVVENPFDPDGRRPGTGVGLANVRDRLQAAYRGAASIRVETAPAPSPVFRVRLSLPAEERSGVLGSPRAGAGGQGRRATSPGGVHPSTQAQGAPSEVEGQVPPP